MKDELMKMNVKCFIELRIEEINAQLDELIIGLNGVAHSPNELTFLAGRISELKEQLYRLNYYLELWDEQDNN